MGKTALATNNLNAAQYILKRQEKSSVFFSLEMSSEQLSADFIRTG